MPRPKKVKEPKVIEPEPEPEIEEVEVEEEEEEVDAEIAEVEVEEVEEVEVEEEEEETAEEEFNASNTKSYEFKAEMNQLMSLIVNTFYSNKDVFVRELLSNASDALDKLRHNALLNKELLGTDTELKVKLLVDKNKKTLTISDNGIGMTHNELITNLGTIAQSGTKSFIDKLAQTKDKDKCNLIGQFGVGFYSAYLASSKVQVFSKPSLEKCGHVWTSDASGSFTIGQLPETFQQRGTTIVCYLKEDSYEYLNENKLKHIIRTHSQYVQYPIQIQEIRYEEKEIPIEEEEEDLEVEETEEVDSENKEEIEGQVEDVSDNENEKKEEKPKTKKIKEEIKEWKTLNDTTPIWTRNKNEISNDEYKQFLKSFTRNHSSYFGVKHFKVEGQIEFTGLIYVPEHMPRNIFNEPYKTQNMKLYVKRVFITDNNSHEQLIPEWLNFICGLVDSEDLPLNVSREMLQQNKVMSIIKKNVVKKCIEMFQEISEDEEKYEKFYDVYSKHIKIGIHEGQYEKAKLINLLRFRSHANPKKFTHLKEYVENMKTDQKEIYYIIDENVGVAQNSPFLESTTKKGYNVLLLTEPIDEYLMQSLDEYDGKRFVNLAQASEQLYKVEKEVEEDFTELISVMKMYLKNKVNEIKLSSRLDSTPCCIVSSQYGWTANMERMMKNTAMTNKKDHMKVDKILEVNPNDSIIKKLNMKAKENKEDKSLANFVHMLYNNALLSSGFVLENKVQFSKTIFNLIRMGVGADEEEDEEETAEEEIESIEGDPEEGQATTVDYEDMENVD